MSCSAPVYKEVVVVGNGPSAITLSYMLAGNWPYYSQEGHPNEFLHRRLMTQPELSIIQQDLEFLSQGLEGRTLNLVSLLFDNLNHPNADLGEEHPSVLLWKNHPDRIFDHVVLGRGAPGGIWQSLEGSILTISLGSWMELPNSSFSRWEAELGDKYNRIKKNRATVAAVADYYKDYVKEQNLRGYFENCCTVTSVKPMCKDTCNQSRILITQTPDNIERNVRMGDNFHGCSFPERRIPALANIQLHCRPHMFNIMNRFMSRMGLVCCEDKIASRSASQATGSTTDIEKPGNGQCKLWAVEGYKEFVDKETGEVFEKKFHYLTPNVVLATGSTDSPNKLHVLGENLDYVLHSLKDLEVLIEGGKLSRNSDPLMVIGAGLSAADAIIAARFHNIPIIHLFRRPVTDKNFVFNRLPPNMYPEYHKVYQMMIDGGCSYEGYKSYPTCQVYEFLPDHRVRIHGETCGGTKRVSYVLSLIGSSPDLSFLPNNGKDLGVIHGVPISCNNPIEVSMFTHESVCSAGLFGLGPVVGDNFVRFVQGGALAITNYLHHKRDMQ